MRKVSTSLSLLVTANVAAVLSLACTGADNSSGPPQTNFTPTATTTMPIATFQPPTVQPTGTTPTTTTTVATTTTSPTTTSAAPTSSVTTTTSAAPTSTAPTSATPTTTATNTSVDNPLDDTTDEETTTEDDEETSVGNPDGDPGIPIDEDSYFPSNSNVMGFKGAWYCFDDGEVPVECGDDGEKPWTAAETGMCITGSTIVDDTYAAWGAGIGASLNDDAGDKDYFDADAKGIKGFKFTITGDLGDAALRFMVPRSTKDTSSPPQVEVKLGSNSIEFSDLEPPEGDDGDELDPAELTELKWQIAGGSVETDYSFCITEVLPLE